MLRTEFEMLDIFWVELVPDLSQDQGGLKKSDSNLL